jgi:hypothetical protein
LISEGDISDERYSKAMQGIEMTKKSILNNYKQIIMSLVLLFITLDVLHAMTLNVESLYVWLTIIKVLSILYLIFKSLKIDFDLFIYAYILSYIFNTFFNNMFDSLSIIFLGFLVLLILYTANRKRKNVKEVLAYVLCYNIAFFEVMIVIISALIVSGIIFTRKLVNINYFTIRTRYLATFLLIVIMLSLGFNINFVQSEILKALITSRSEFIAFTIATTFALIYSMNNNYKRIILFQIITIISSILQYNLELILFCILYTATIIIRYENVGSKNRLLFFIFPLIILFAVSVREINMNLIILNVVALILFLRLRFNKGNIKEWFFSSYIVHDSNYEFYDIAKVDNDFYIKSNIYNLSVDNAEIHYFTLGWYFKLNPNMIINEEFIQSKLSRNSWQIPALSQLNSLASSGEDVTIFVNEKYYKERYLIEDKLGAQDYFCGGWKRGRNPRPEINSNLIIVQLYPDKPKNPILEFLKFYPQDIALKELIERPQISGKSYSPFI